MNIAKRAYKFPHIHLYVHTHTHTHTHTERYLPDSPIPEGGDAVLAWGTPPIVLKPP